MGTERERTGLPLRRLVRGGSIVRFLVVTLLAGSSPSAAQQIGPDPTGAVEITVLDVGQGDAIIVRGPDGTTVMVDAGRESPLRALSRLGVDSIALLVATHPHADHIGGVDAVLTARPVGTFIDAGASPESATHQRLNATLDRLSGVERVVAVDTSLRVGGMTVQIVAPDDPDGGSVGVVVRHGVFSVLLPGDAEEDQLRSWLERGVISEATVLKAAHHGSETGFTFPFVDASSPELVVISVGSGNRLGHPRPEALTAYSQIAEHVLRTDLDGHVTIRGFPDGSYIVLTGETLDDRREWGAGGEGLAAPDGEVAVDIRVVVDAPGARQGDLNSDVATLTNRSGDNLDLSGWRLCDLSTRCFRFPEGTTVAPGRRVAVYTGYGMPDGVSFFMNNDRRVWNEDGDEATLYDRDGGVVARHVY